MTWYIVGAILLFNALVAILAYYGGQRRADRKIVYDYLNDAWDGGHFEPGAYLDGYSAVDIAYDMRCYGEETEDMPFQFVVRCARAWMKEKGLSDGD